MRIFARITTLPDSLGATYVVSRDLRHACSLLHEKMLRSERIPDSTGVRDGNATESNLGTPHLRRSR